MKRFNSYLIDADNNYLKVLFEVLSNNSDGIVNYYYELILRLGKEHGKLKLLSVDSYKEINNPIEYIFNIYGDRNINDFKLSDNMTKLIHKFISKKSLDDSSRINVYYNTSDNYKLIPKKNNYIIHDHIYKPIVNSTRKRNNELFNNDNNENDYDKKYIMYKETIKRLKGLRRY